MARYLQLIAKPQPVVSGKTGLLDSILNHDFVNKNSGHCCIGIGLHSLTYFIMHINGPIKYRFHQGEQNGNQAQKEIFNLHRLLF